MNFNTQTLQIICCDSNTDNLYCTVSMLQKQLKSYKPNGTAMDIAVKGYCNPCDLLSLEEPIHLLITETEFPETNGLELAQLLEKKHRQMMVIFLTQQAKHLQQGYIVGAFRYLFKNDGAAVLWHSVEQALATLMREHIPAKVLVPNTEKKMNIYLPISEIHYIKSNGYQSIICSSSSDFASSSPLREWQKKLEPLFYRCHESYLVNVQHVIALYYGDGIAELTGEKRIPVAFRRRSHFRHYLEECLHHQATSLSRL